MRFSDDQSTCDDAVRFILFPSGSSWNISLMLPLSNKAGNKPCNPKDVAKAKPFLWRGERVQPLTLFDTMQVLL